MLYGGKRVSKTDPRVHAYGSVDELSAIIGVILAESVPQELREQLLKIQRMLYKAGADLATPNQSPSTSLESGSGQAKWITQEDVTEVEQWIDDAEARVPPLTHFILPGGTRTGAFLHQARTVCRRAEREGFALSEIEDVNAECLKYLNRLGDFFFAAARIVNRKGGVEETTVGGISTPPRTPPPHS